MVARHLAKVDVAGSNPVFRSNCVAQPQQTVYCNITDANLFCGNSAVVARHLAKVDVAGSNPVFRSNEKRFGFHLNRFFYFNI